MKKIVSIIAAGLLSLPCIASGVEKKLLDAAGIEAFKQEAPGFHLALDNKKVSLADLKGKVIVLHIWATWCKACKEEFPLFNSFYLRFKDRDVVFLPVAIDADVDNKTLAALAKGFGAQFPVYLAKEGEITGRYWSWGVPVTYIIDKKGSIAGRAIGRRDWASKEMASLIEALIKE